MMTKYPFRFCLCILLTFWATILPVQAQTKDSCVSIANTVQLVPNIVEQSSQGQRVFYHQRVTISYQAYQRVIIASTPDGTGSISSDDLSTIQVFPGISSGLGTFATLLALQLYRFQRRILRLCLYRARIRLRLVSPIWLDRYIVLGPIISF